MTHSFAWQCLKAVLLPRRGAENGRKFKPRGVEPRQPLSRFFVIFSLCCPCLASARLRPPHRKPQQNLLLRGAKQFSQNCFSARQVKFRREYLWIFSRDFPQYWRKAASENLSGFDSPRLKRKRDRSKPILPYGVLPLDKGRFFVFISRGARSAGGGSHPPAARRYRERTW